MQLSAESEMTENGNGKWDYMYVQMMNGNICNHMWRMRCEALWHGKMEMEWNDALEWNGSWSEMKHAQVLRKELATFSKWRKTEMQTSNMQKQTQKKNVPLAKDSNMSISKLLQYANSKLEFGKKSKTWKWTISSFLKGKCTFHGI